MIPPIKRRVRPYTIAPLVGGGFSVTVNSEVPEGTVLTIDVAYDIPNGNPLKNWAPQDFRLDYMTVEVEGCNLTERSGNRITVASTGESLFKVSVRGFGSNRDLFVDALLSEDS